MHAQMANKVMDTLSNPYGSFQCIASSKGFTTRKQVMGKPDRACPANCTEVRASTSVKGTIV